MLNTIKNRTSLRGLYHDRLFFEWPVTNVPGLHAPTKAARCLLRKLWLQRGWFPPPWPKSFVTTHSGVAASVTTHKPTGCVRNRESFLKLLHRGTNMLLLRHRIIHFSTSSAVSEWAMRLNERAYERVAQYLRSDSWLFWTTVCWVLSRKYSICFWLCNSPSDIRPTSVRQSVLPPNEAFMNYEKKIGFCFISSWTSLKVFRHPMRSVDLHAYTFFFL